MVTVGTERGVALVSALFLAAAVGLFAAALFGIAFLDGAAAANQISGEGAFHSAEAGVERVWSLLPPAPSFAAELAWQGGPPPFGAVVDFPSPPGSYRVTVTAVTPERLSVRSLGTAVRGSRRRIDASFCREPAFAPAAPMILAPAVRVGLAAGGIAIDGADRDGIAPPTAPLAIERGEDIAAARALSADPVLELPLGSGLGEAAAALRTSADRVESGPFTSAAFGDAIAPAVVRIVGDGEILGASSASGLLVADAPLRIRGRLDVLGILVAAAGLTLEGELVVTGLLHLAGDVDLLPGSRIAVTRATSALDAADRLRPGVLPKNPVLCGWREVW